MHRLLLLPLLKRRVCDLIFFHFLLLLAPKDVCVHVGEFSMCAIKYTHTSSLKRLNKSERSIIIRSVVWFMDGAALCPRPYLI